MEILPIIFSVVLVVLAIVLAVVGVQMVLVLLEVRKTLQKFNQTLDSAEAKFTSVLQPLQRLGGMATGLSTGMKVFEAFVGWLHRHQEMEKRS